MTTTNTPWTKEETDDTQTDKTEKVASDFRRCQTSQRFQMMATIDEHAKLLNNPYIVIIALKGTEKS